MKEKTKEKLYILVRYLIPLIICVISVRIFTLNAIQLEMSLIESWITGVATGLLATMLGGLIIYTYLMSRG